MVVRLDQLREVTAAQYLREHRKIRAILEEEARLRRALRQLEDQPRAAAGGDPAMRMLGADVLWQAWVSRTRRALNIELAQVLARKSVAMGAIRTASGRREAVLKIIAREDEVQAGKRRARFYENLIRDT